MQICKSGLSARTSERLRPRKPPEVQQSPATLWCRIFFR